jgi:hypothetical protein
MISANVAPLARFIIAITPAFLFARSVLGLMAAFLARVFFEGLAFLARLRLLVAPAASPSGLLSFTKSISLIEFLLAACCGRHSHHSGAEKWQGESQAMRSKASRVRANWRVQSFFIWRQNQSPCA